MKKIFAACLAAWVTFSIAHAEPFVGEWAGDCGEYGAQCWLEIEKQGSVYDVAYVAANPMDAADVLCRVEANMERGPVGYDVHNTYEDALSGTLLEGYAFIYEDGNGGAIGLGGGLGSGFACGKYMMQGHYYAFGD